MDTMVASALGSHRVMASTGGSSKNSSQVLRINTSAQGSHGLRVSMRGGLFLIPTNSSWGLNPL